MCAKQRRVTMSDAWRRATASSAPARPTVSRPRAARSPLTRQVIAASTAPAGATPAVSDADGQAACARAGAAAMRTAATRATARTRERADRRAVGDVRRRTSDSAAGPRGGVPGMNGACAPRGPVHKTTLVLGPDATNVSLVDEAVAPRPERGLEPVVDADLAEDVAEVALDRLRADAQAERDLLVRDPRADEGEDLALAIADRLAVAVTVGGGLGRRRAAPALGHERHRDPGRQGRATVGGGADAGEQLRGLGVLEQVADGSRVDRVRDPSRLRERGEDHDARPPAAPA